jgi:hypothetical protein
MVTGTAAALEPPAARPANEYLLSFLIRRYLLVGDKFVVRHPHAWLVWEPIEGTTEVVGSNAAETWIPGRDVKRTVSVGDALCFELVASSPEARFHVGRSRGQLIISPNEVEQTYCVLALKDSWSVAAAAGMTAMEVSGNPLAPGIEVPLQDGARLELDELRLVFYEAAMFAQRIASFAFTP